ncbi:MAG: 50S ribosomal protein L13 [Methanomassiliicoccus sp.]|nr:50S ribosomal protein L13 [Methanomassiliicoccus sp.]
MAIIINAEGHILGRLSTNVAKRLLNGEDVIVVNAEKAIITGNRDMVFDNYTAKHNRGKQINGPFFPKRADLILKRTVRGMIPFKSPRGREVYRHLKVFVGVPKDLESAKMEKVEAATNLWTDKYVTLGEVAEHLGSRLR